MYLNLCTFFFTFTILFLYTLYEKIEYESDDFWNF